MIASAIPDLQGPILGRPSKRVILIGSFVTVETTPLPVSVVIPAYNRPDLVGRAVRSALTQRPQPPAEVVVVDDCSSDATGAAARAAGARVIRHEVNRGEGAARNTAIRAARGEWVAMLDSDDEWLDGHLAALWPHAAGRRDPGQHGGRHRQRAGDVVGPGTGHAAGAALPGRSAGGRQRAGQQQRARPA